MKILTIPKSELLEALTERAHVGAILEMLPYKVAVKDGTGRVIFADSPSSKGGYFANNEGESNYHPEQFLQDDSDYTWGEDSEEYHATAAEAAQSWIEENLMDSVELHAVEYAVNYI